MTPDHWLDEVVRVGGVRGAAVITADDGLVVHEVAVAGVSAADVAALASALVRRAAMVMTPCRAGEPTMLTLTASGGTVVAARAEQDLWLVAVTEPSAELGRLRLLLSDLAADVA